MSDTVIKVENLSKKYIIRHQQAQNYTALRDVIADGVKSIGRRLSGAKQDPSMGSTQEEFWALKDVSFEVKQGDRIGIIGRNGAGKSTLLKILSRIIEPTEGEISISGRVASLLEVGTGFHPELTGNENIFLNGAILGMRKAEIKKKFDAIVDFAEVEKFIDTPVKHYSSGMYVRLAFAVAAHLEPEILIIDEVLAVGDAQFQKKCLGKIEDISTGEGKTILFVSHSMSMISALCQKAILLESGRVTRQGFPSEVILEYYGTGKNSSGYVNLNMTGKLVGDDYAELIEVYLKNSQGSYTTEIFINEPLTIGMRYKILRNREFKEYYPYPAIYLIASDGTKIFYSMPQSNKFDPPLLGTHTAECIIPGNFLNNDKYSVGLGFASCENNVKVHFYEDDLLAFNAIEDLEKTLENQRNGWASIIPAMIRPELEWSIRFDK
jgi:lipopolysaccharide transport system ATP-binding protein